MFATDMSNCTPASLYLKVVRQYSHTLYTLNHAVGTITQVNTRTFNQSFNKMGPYPSAQQCQGNPCTLDYTTDPSVTNLSVT